MYFLSIYLNISFNYKYNSEDKTSALDVPSNFKVDSMILFRKSCGIYNVNPLVRLPFWEKKTARGHVRTSGLHSSSITSSQGYPSDIWY